MTTKRLLTAKYKLSMKDIAAMFGYSSVKSLYASSRKAKILNGVEELIAHIEFDILNKLKAL